MEQVDPKIFKEFTTGATLGVVELRRVNAARVQRTMHLIFTCERHILDTLSAASQEAGNSTVLLEPHEVSAEASSTAMVKAVHEAMDTLRILHSLLEGDPSADVGAALAGEHPIPRALNPSP
jgi:hypothetical protein